ncbi:MAG: hypothetical protein H7Y17_11255 [Chlorobia bacterium]|nr:hypothetical protein [Fimbriimonadaceae bacterium]
MSHERKKDGQRKDKKNERMREDVKERHENAAQKTSSDQPDIQAFKPGAPSDKNADPSFTATKGH